MPEFTYLAFDLVTGRVLGDVPLRGAQPSWEVSAPGNLGGPTIALNPLNATQRQDVRDATIPWKCGIAVDRNGQIIWSGVVTTRRYSSQSGSYTLDVSGLLAYWQVRLLSANLTWVTPVEQVDMIRTLMLSGAEPSVPLGFDAPASGVERQRQIDGGNLTSVLDEVTQISDNEGGFEFVLESRHVSQEGAPAVAHTLRVGSPTLSAADPDRDPPLVLEFPGNASEYTWDEDGSTFATDMWGSSTTDEGVTMVRSASNPALLTQGYPRVERSGQWSNISVVATLDAHIRQALAEAAAYANAPTVTVRDDGGTSIGGWAVGDLARMRVTDERRFPPDLPGQPGLDEVLRIRSATLDPETRKITMTLAPIVTTEA
jgi:hypothetical protein